MRLPGFLRRRTGSSVHTRKSLRESARDEWARDRGEYQGSRVGGKADEADMSEKERRIARELSRNLYNKNGIYGAVVDRFVDHVMGDGVVITVEDEAAQAWLDDQLGKPETRFHETLGQRVARFIVDGEMPVLISTLARGASAPESPDPEDEEEGSAHSAPVNTGDFFIGRLDVEGVTGVGVSPFNHDAVVSVTYKAPAGGKDPEIPIAKPGTPLIPFDDNFKPLGLGKDSDGIPSRLCALQLWQARTIGKRSGPLFSRIIDRAGSLDDVFEEFIRKVEYLNRWWVHIRHKLQGDEAQGENSKDLAFAKEMTDLFTSLESGEAVVTDLDTEVEAQTPDLKMADMKEFYDVVIDMILGAYAIPRFWYSSGGDTNRATAAEQGSPIYKFVKSWQASVLKVCIEDLVRYLLDLGMRAGVKGLGRGAETPFTVVMADVATRDSIRDADEMLRMAVALREYEDLGAISSEEMVQVLRANLKSKWFGDMLEGEGPEAEEEDEVDIDDPLFEGADPDRKEEDQDSTPAGSGLTPMPKSTAPAA